MLAALWKHRKSMDLDITLPSQSGLSALSPAWNREFTDGMAELGATGVHVQTEALKFEFASGRVELVANDPTPPIDPIPVDIDGYASHVLPTACILAGKLSGRGLSIPSRDIFDVGVASQLSPSALACAVNHLDPHTRSEMLAHVGDVEDLYRAEASSVIVDPAPRWRHLLQDGPDIMASAIVEFVYRDIKIDFDRGRARASVNNTAQGERSREFESPQALLAGLVRMGLGPWVVAQYGTAEKFLEAVGPEFEGQGRLNSD